MRAWFPGSRATGQECASAVRRPAGSGSAWARTYLIDWRGIRKAERACCCPAKPVVVAVMPPSAGRLNQTDLLLCGHHYRVSRQALCKAGAVILDINGLPLDPQEPPEARAGAPASSASLS